MSIGRKPCPRCGAGQPKERVRKEATGGDKTPKSLAAKARARLNQKVIVVTPRGARLVRRFETVADQVFYSIRDEYRQDPGATVPTYIKQPSKRAAQG